MKISALMAIVIFGLNATAAQSKSLIDKSPQWIIENILAWGTPIVVRCNEHYILNHNAFDLVWDIYELKSKIDIEKDPEGKERLALATKNIDASFGKKWDCDAAYGIFGPGGKLMPDFMSRK